MNVIQKTLYCIKNFVLFSEKNQRKKFKILFWLGKEYTIFNEFFKNSHVR